MRLVSTDPLRPVFDLSSAPPRVIGVLSDSHVPFRLEALPQAAFDLLRRCDLILHAGDLEDTRLISQLSRIAPVYTVRGNIHWTYSTGTHDLDLPEAVTLQLGAHTLWMTHGHLSFGYTMLDKALQFARRPTLDDVNRTIVDRLSRVRPPEADIVVFGHSHNPWIETRDGVLYFNPGAIVGTTHFGGAARPPSLGTLTFLTEGAVIPGILTLSPEGAP